jgi:hypothetical protein
VDVPGARDPALGIDVLVVSHEHEAVDALVDVFGQEVVKDDRLV